MAEKVVAKPSITIQVNGQSREFPLLGSMIRLDAISQLRTIRQQSFQSVISGISQSWDPTVAATSLREALQQFQNSMIVQDQEVQSWLSFSYDGKAFLVCRSLKKSDSKLSSKDINEIVDNMTESQIDEIACNVIVGMWPDNEFLHSMILPQLFDDKKEPTLE